MNEHCRVFTATTVGGDSWASVGLPGDDARDTFGDVIMSLLSKVDDPPLHLDLFEFVDGADLHYATIRFGYPGTWEIVEPNAPFPPLGGGGVDPSGYAADDLKSMHYGRA